MSEPATVSANLERSQSKRLPPPLHTTGGFVRTNTELFPALPAYPPARPGEVFLRNPHHTRKRHPLSCAQKGSNCERVNGLIPQPTIGRALRRRPTPVPVPRSGLATSIWAASGSFAAWLRRESSTYLLDMPSLPLLARSAKSRAFACKAAYETTSSYPIPPSTVHGLEKSLCSCGQTAFHYTIHKV